jgi:phage terminase small subunit
MDKLTPQQEAFCRAYALNNGNASQAALSAGYSAKAAKEQGCRLLTKAHIVDYIKGLSQPKVTHELDTIEGRRARLQSIADRAERQGDELKALDQLSKMCGDYIERKHITGELSLGFTAYIPKKGSK